MCFCLCFFDFRFIFVIIKYSPVLFNNFAFSAADIGDQLVFRCSRPVFKLSGEINLIWIRQLWWSLGGKIYDNLKQHNFFENLLEKFIKHSGIFPFKVTSSQTGV